METYIPRSLESVILKAVREFPAVTLSGPRQSGKTTLVKHVFQDIYEYISLEAPDIRDAAQKDPRSFLALHPPPAIYDEIQYAPELLPYIKEHIDNNRSMKGQFILTGSQNLLLAKDITESLAGRVAVLRLLPFSIREITGEIDRPFPWEKEPSNGSVTGWQYEKLGAALIRGWYPELVAEPGRYEAGWHSSYINTYLERDIRMLSQIGDLSLFHNFLEFVAVRSGQLLNITALSRDLGVAVNTAKKWLSILEATYQIVLVMPYFANIGKRLVKTPKVYFLDTGTLCYLSKITRPEHALAGPLGGAVFETAVFTEIFKTCLHRWREPSIYFWRTSAGTEVDFIVEIEGRRLVPIEVKLSATPRTPMAKQIRAFRADFGERALPGFVVHPGDVTLPLGEGITAIPFTGL